MTKLKKGNFIFSICLLVVLAIFSFGLSMLAKPNVYASNDLTISEESDDEPLIGAEKNIVITATELIIGLCAGGVLVRFRNFDYLGKVEDANLDYQEYVEEIQKMQKKLTVTNQKILSLSKKVGKVNGE